MIIAILRSVAVSGILLFVLPMLFGIRGVWYAMPASDFIVAVLALVYIYKQPQGAITKTPKGAK